MGNYGIMPLDKY